MLESKIAAFRNRHSHKIATLQELATFTVWASPKVALWKVGRSLHQISPTFREEQIKANTPGPVDVDSMPGPPFAVYSLERVIWATAASVPSSMKWRTRTRMRQNESMRNGPQQGLGNLYRNVKNPGWKSRHGNKPIIHNLGGTAGGS